MCRVSVVMASYNHGPYVGAAVESVLAQTFGDFELLVVDDASTDDTAEVVAAVTDQRIHLTRFPINRWDSPRNAALKHARGEYVAIINSDDRWARDKLEQQVAFLDAHKDHGAVFTWVRFIDSHGAELSPGDNWCGDVFEQDNRSRHQWLRHLFFNGNCLCHPSVMYRRSLLQEIGPYNPRFAQLSDYDMFVRLCAVGEIHVIAEKLTSMRLLAKGRNASAPSQRTIRRENFERCQLLRHYRRSPIIEQWPEIFADLLATDDTSDGSLELAVARRCLADSAIALRHFGLELLYELLGDESRRHALQKEGEAILAEFFDATGRHGPLAPNYLDLLGVRVATSLRSLPGGAAAVRCIRRLLGKN